MNVAFTTISQLLWQLRRVGPSTVGARGRGGHFKPSCCFSRKNLTKKSLYRDSQIADRERDPQAPVLGSTISAATYNMSGQTLDSRARSLEWGGVGFGVGGGAIVHQPHFLAPGPEGGSLQGKTDLVGRHWGPKPTPRMSAMGRHQKAQSTTQGVIKCRKGINGKQSATGADHASET